MGFFLCVFKTTTDVQSPAEQRTPSKEVLEVPARRKTYLLVLVNSDTFPKMIFVASFKFELLIGAQLGTVALVSACSFHWCLWFHWFSG